MRDYSGLLLKGDGLSGGSTKTSFYISIDNRTTSYLKHHNGAVRVRVFLTSLQGKDIISEATTRNNWNGTYTCKYLSPVRQGNYSLHVEVNGDLLFGFPCPIYFSNDMRRIDVTFPYNSSAYVSEKNHKERVENNLQHVISDSEQHNNLAGQAINSNIELSLGQTQFASALANYRLGIYTAFQTAQSESTTVKVLEISPHITIEKLQELVSCYSRPQEVEFREQNTKRVAVINFFSKDEANECLKLSGLVLGDQSLRIEKWINASANGRIQMSSPSTISSYQNSASSLPNKPIIHSYHNILPESSKIEPSQWQEEWKAKQQFQRNMMEQYASLVATSRFNMVNRQTTPQSMQKKRNYSSPNSRNNTRTIVNTGQNNDKSREQNEETGNEKSQPSPKARRLLENSLLQRTSAVVPLSKLEEWDLL